MSVLPILPQGFVVGRILTSRGDSADADKKADTAVVVGMVDFSPATAYRKLDAATVVTHSKITAKLDSHGDLHPQRDTNDNTGSDTEDGIWLPVGTWKVTYRLNAGFGALPEHNIEVTSAHTEPSPLPLFANMGDAPVPGATYVQLTVPLGGQQGQVLIMSDGSLAWGDPAGVGGGLDTEGVQDIVGAMVTGAGGTYDDAAGTITLPSGGGGASELTPVTSNTTSPAGTRAGQLVGYLNTAAAAITVNGQPLAAGAWAIFGWSGSAWVQMNTGTLIPAADPTSVTPTGPTWTDDTINGGGTWTTPTQTGVTYSPASGTATPGQSVTVTATAQSGYTLTGTTSWQHTFPATPSLDTDALDAAILALSPVGYWKLEDASGTTALDSSGNSRHGTYAGAYTLGGRDGAATFDGGYVEVPDDDDWSIAGATAGFTVFALTYTNGIISTRQHIIAKGSTDKYEWGIDVKESAKSGALEGSCMHPGGFPMMAAATTTTQPAAAWSGACVAFPPHAYQAAPAIYRDNNTPLATTAPNWQPEEAIANGTAPLRIAGRADNVGPWMGALRRVAIFRTQLTAAQVGTLMGAARADGLIP